MMDRICRIAVIDDHPLVREGIVHAVSTEEDFEVVAVGEAADEAVEVVNSSQPDILILDLSIPGGGDQALKQVKSARPETLVLVLTVSDDEEDVLKMLALGASGYVLKGTTGYELVDALRIVMAGQQYITPSLANRMLAEIAHNQQPSRPATFAELSDRERHIAIRVGEGDSNKVIAQALNLSEKTIKHYLTSIFKKTDVSNRVELAILVRSQTESHG